MATKKIIEVHQAAAPHWVGDGFPVTSVFTMQAEMGKKLSPFLMLDYAPIAKFEPTDKRRGVGSHPHKGFETVTIVYQGGLEHRDSSGSSGTIGPGDVQWMTAGSGLLHEEMHERKWAKEGGIFHVAQLWVNLPAKDKSVAPSYQTLVKNDIPTIDFPSGAGTMRVIAGEYKSIKGPAKTFTPINVYDLRLKTGKEVALNFTPDFHTALVVQVGQVQFNNDQTVNSVTLAIADTQNETINIKAEKEAMLLVLSGKPIDEPIAAYGPFVMNTKEQIQSAIEDFRAGKMGEL